VCTDLQGCLRDFQRIAAVFRAAHEQSGDAYLLFTGDLIHGPRLAREQWPDFLGEYYLDQSAELIEAFLRLSQRHLGRVHALLGNHEHGHIGGPHTAKFAPDEVRALESELGRARTASLRALLRRFPLIAVAPCGAVFSHAAPAAEISSPADIEAAQVDAGLSGAAIDVLSDPVLGPLLWARTAEPAAVQRFLAVLGGTLAVHGHEVVAEGYRRVDDHRMVVSTSFGLGDGAKVYLDLDLGSRYRDARDLRRGREILPLYPERARWSERPATAPRRRPTTLPRH
jgi:hypothetical protein